MAKVEVGSIIGRRDEKAYWTHKAIATTSP